MPPLERDTPNGGKPPEARLIPNKSPMDKFRSLARGLLAVSHEGIRSKQKEQESHQDKSAGSSE